MTHVNELFPRARKLKYELQQQLALVRVPAARARAGALICAVAQVERGQFSADDCLVGLSALEQQLLGLDGLAAQEGRQQRELWRQKIDELRHECSFLRTELEK